MSSSFLPSFRSCSHLPFPFPCLASSLPVSNIAPLSLPASQRSTASLRFCFPSPYSSCRFPFSRPLLPIHLAAFLFPLPRTFTQIGLLGILLHTFSLTYSANLRHTPLCGPFAFSFPKNVCSNVPPVCSVVNVLPARFRQPPPSTPLFPLQCG